MKLFDIEAIEGMKKVCSLKEGSPLKIYRITYPRIWNGDDWHFHPQGYEYYIPLTGQITVLVESKEVIVCAGEMLCVYPGEKHRVVGGSSDQDTIVIRQEFLKNDSEIYLKEGA